MPFNALTAYGPRLMISAHVKTFKGIASLTIDPPFVLNSSRSPAKYEARGFKQAVTQGGGAGEDKTNLDSRGSRAERALV